MCHYFWSSLYWEVVVMVSRVVPHATTLGYFRYLYSGLVAAARCAECRCHPRKSAGSRGGGEKVPRRDQEYSSACFSAGRGAESSALVTPTSTFTITNINNQCRGSDLGVGSVLPLPAKIQVIYPGINLEL